MDRVVGVDGSTPAKQVGAHLCLLGVPSLRRPDGSLHFLERLEAALLAHLLIDGPMSRAGMAALLWPEVDARRARGNLRQRLRRLKTAAGFDPLADADPLRVRADLGHDLRPQAAASDDGPGAAELLAGLDFADIDGLHEWVVGARRRVGAARRALIEQRAAQHEASAELVAALRLAHRLLEIDGLDESAHRRVMRLHHARGDRAGALHVFQHCKEVLARELGAAPGRETRLLAAEIESGAPPREAAARPRPVTLARPPRLIGRDRELAAVRHGWQHGSIVAVLGEAGVGKSRLLAQCMASQACALSIGARPGDAQVPFALLVRLLRAVPGLAAAADMPSWVRLQLGHLLPELGRPDSPSLNPLRLRQALVWVLGNLLALQQGALVIDDLQFADEATLEVLPALLAAQVQPPLRWLLAARIAEIPALLRSALEGGEPLRATVVRLEPLALHDVQALLDSLSLDGLDAATWAAPLHRHTGGNPMFILQTLLSMGDGTLGASALSSAAALPLPGRVGELVDRRIAQLSAEARELAQVAALAGQNFDARLAMHVLERRAADLADAWRELEAAQVLRDEAFAHDLIFEATLRSVPAAAAGPWRGCIAEHMAAAGGPLPHIAAHWQAAGQWARAGRAYAQAAAQLTRQMRQLEEVRLLHEALACFVAAGESDGQLDACWCLFQAQWRRKHWPGIHEARQRLHELATVAPRARALAAYAAAAISSDGRRDPASLPLLDEAQALAEGEGNLELAVLTLSLRSHSLSIVNRSDEAVQAGRHSLLLADRLPRSSLTIEAALNAGAAFELCGQLDAADEQLRRAEEAYRAWDDPGGVAEVQCWQSMCAYHRGRIDEAAELLGNGYRALAEINGGQAPVNTPTMYLGRCWRDQGRLGEALALLEDAYTRSIDSPEVNMHAGICLDLGLTWLALGQLHRVHPLADKIRRVPRRMTRFEGLLLECDLARVEGRSSRPYLEAALELVPHCPRSERYRWRVDAEMSAHLPADEALPVLERVVRQSRAQRIWSCAGPAWVRLVEALLRGRPPDAAAQQARALACELERLPPMNLYAGEYHWAICRAFDAAGDTAARDAALRRAVAWVDDTARRQVPEVFRDSFLNRNPFNRQLRAMATRHVA